MERTVKEEPYHTNEEFDFRSIVAGWIVSAAIILVGSLIFGGLL
jgi:hypothetical protein